MHLDAWTARAAALRPDAVALETAAARWSYAELSRAAAGLAEALGLRPGERVAFVLGDPADMALALHACLAGGAVLVPVDARLAPAERGRLAAAAQRTVEALPPAQPADPAPREPGPGDPLMVVHTSGTTGAPRPVTLSYGNVLASALGSAVALGLDPAERWLCPLPLSHVGGLMVLLRSAIYATTAVLRPLEGAALHGATLASLVPTQLARALDAGLADPPGLRAVLLGGAGAPRPLLERAAAAGVPVAQTYGLTQACSQVTVSTPGDLESQGRPLHGTRVTIAPDGEIVVAGPTVAGGGALATGDLGRLDARGRLVVVGRKADTIVTGGENVAPAEVEAVLLAHPAVADAGVFGRPDPEWGEAVVAHVVLREPADPEALRAFARERLAGYKVPKRIEAVAALPRTGSGKLLRRALSSRP
jgi:O-succinylbenzoic acid--CoA ligase